jgi:hemoglobin
MEGRLSGFLHPDSTIKTINWGGYTMSENSLYDRLGGEAAVNAAVDLFYGKVLDDYRINRFFDGMDMSKQAAHLKAFMSLAFGGPNEYTGRSLRDGHARLVKKGLDDSHFDAVMEHLGATLTELNVPADLIAEAAALVESVRGEVLGRG